VRESGSVGRVVSLLDADVELGQGIPEPDREQARQRAAVRTIEITNPAWDPSAICRMAGSEWFGLYVLEGLVIRKVGVAGRLACEFLGPGDVFRPWATDGDYDPLSIHVDWLVVARSELAILDSRLARRMARWPSFAVALTERTAARARNLTMMAAVTHIPRTTARLIQVFWLLADRWGKVTPDGVLITLPLTHQVLAMLSGCHRPTVSITLQKLAREGLLIRQAPSRWLLTRTAIEMLHDQGGMLAQLETSYRS